ncbi:MAG: hypothetical protein QM757_24490 [Paludibaculum sp.]
MAVLENIEIRDILPHRYPFLLVDRIVEMDEDTIVGIKNVTINEPFFHGHFPDFPVMPGVLIVEAHGAGAPACSCSSQILTGHNKIVLIGLHRRSEVPPARACRAISSAWN